MVEPPADYVPGESCIGDSSGFYNQETVDDLDSPVHKQREAQQSPTAEVGQAGSKAERVFRPVEEADPMLPTGQWASPHSQRNRKRLLIAVASFGGLLLLVIVIAFAVRGGDDDDAAAGTPDTADAGQDQTDGNDDPPQPAKRNGDPKQAVDDKKKTDQKGAVDPPPDTKQPSRGGDTGDNRVPENGGDGNDPDKKDPSTPKGDGGANKPPDEIDNKPPGLEPKTKDPATAKDLSNALEQFAPFLTNPSFDSTGRSAELRTAPPKIAIPRPTPRRVDVKRRLEDRLLGIEYQGVSLGRFLRDMTNLSTIPITLDTDALLAQQVSPSTKVTVKLQNATVADALTAVLEPLQLAHVVDPTGHLIVTWLDKPGQPELAEERFEVEDLVAGDAADRNLLLELLKTLIAPSSWGETIGEGPTMRFDNRTLVVRQNRAVQFRLRILLDKLRVARGLAPRSSFTKLVMLPPRTNQILPKLSQAGSFTFRYATPLTTIVDKIAGTGKLDVMINWQAAAKVGWSPTAESTLVVKDKLVSEAFSNVLDPMDLTLRVVDSSTVEVTTWKALESHLDVEAFPVGHVTTPQSVTEWMAKLRKRLEANTRFAASRDWALYYDERSKHLFARLPQIQQIKLAKILVKR